MEIDLNAESVNRIKTENIPEPGIHLKNVAREKNRRAAWQNEMIRISVLDSDGNERMGCTWRIPRNKLTTAFLQEIINRSPAKEDPDGCAIEFLRDSAGVDVIWPEQMQQECNPKPFSYYVVKKFVTEGYDALDDKHYSGDLRILLQNVPLKTSNELYSVRMEDVRAWVMFGVVEEDAYVQKYVKKVAHLKKALELMDARIKMQATNKLFDDRAKEIVGGKADLERMDRYLELSREKETIEAEHDHAQQEVEKTMQQRLGSMLTVRQGRVDMVSDRCTWIVEFGGINKDKFENMVAHKTDWSGIRLAVGTQNGKQQPYTCRGLVPDGSKPYIPDFSEFLVNMRGVRITRLEDGFGTYQELDRQSSELRGKKFQFYHGTFTEGKKDGHGVWYTDEGIYSGQVKDDQPYGKGRMDFANGDSHTGAFAVRSGHRESLLGPNPYARGEPNGTCKRTFGDGSFYEGDMSDGQITGKGTYINAMGERYDGELKSGIFHGKGKFTSVAGETFDGNYFQGKLHGFGTYVNSREDSYTGYFDRGEKHGKGMEKFNNHNQFIGFYQDGLRINHGEFFIGNVQEEIGERGEIKLKYDMKHEGPWRAGIMRSGGAVTFSATRNAWPSMNKKSARYEFLSNLKSNEDLATKRQNKQKKKMYDVDRLLRKEIERKKLKVFRQQRHQAKKNMYYAYEYPESVTNDVIEGSLEFRKQRKEMANNKQKKIIESPRNLEDAEMLPGLRIEEPAHFMKLIPKLQLQAEEITKLISDGGEKPRHTILSKLLQSDFEEMEERRRLIDLKKKTDTINTRVERMYKAMETPGVEGGGGEGG